MSCHFLDRLRGGSKRPWPPLIKKDECVKAKVEKLFDDIAKSGLNPR
jgi:hypothetical protein